MLDAFFYAFSQREKKSFRVWKAITNNLNIDEIGVALAHFINSHAGDVGLSLQSDWIDGPIEAIDIVDHMASTLPDILCGLRSAWLINATSQGNGLTLYHHFRILADKSLPRGI